MKEPEAYSFSPIDKLPDKKTPTGYFRKPIENWGWQDFLEYFDDSYKDEFKVASPLQFAGWQARTAYKSRIESAYQFWGKAVFRHMIDIIFDIYKDYPEWGEVTINLICGTHHWAAMIGNKASKRREHSE
jgi:hypothetical protein